MHQGAGPARGSGRQGTRLLHHVRLICQSMLREAVDLVSQSVGLPGHSWRPRQVWWDRDSDKVNTRCTLPGSVHCFFDHVHFAHTGIMFLFFHKYLPVISTLPLFKTFISLPIFLYKMHAWHARHCKTERATANGGGTGRCEGTNENVTD